MNGARTRLGKAVTKAQIWRQSTYDSFPWHVLVGEYLVRCATQENAMRQAWSLIVFHRSLR